MIFIMMNNYFKITLSNKNEFRTEASFEIGGNLYSNVDVKIDTGCPRTSFPIQKLGVSDAEAYKLKYTDCQDPSIKKSISFGVNDTLLKRQEDTKKYKAKRYMELTSISFCHVASGLTIGNCLLGDFPVLVSYDRTGNVLIGMDILKNLDAHIGTTEQGNTVFVACPKNQLSLEYQEELSSLFNLKRVE